MLVPSISDHNWGWDKHYTFGWSPQAMVSPIDPKPSPQMLVKSWIPCFFPKKISILVHFDLTFSKMLNWRAISPLFHPVSKHPCWSARPWDEFKPYRLGGPLRNASEPPMSPLGLPPPYDAIGPAIQAVSAHIHCAVLCPLDFADEDTQGLEGLHVLAMFNKENIGKWGLTSIDDI